MPIIKWTPFLDSFDELDKSLIDMMPSWRPIKSQFIPAVDIYEDKDNVIVETELAGVDPKNVDVSIENDVLTIKGESQKESEVDEKNYYRREIRRGSFFRSVQLPSRVLADKAEAVAEAGVLKITIPKSPEVKPKTIKIKTEKK